ncbi:MAG: hypothetical protein AAFR92_04280 [Pseudomonadota bacterium]
MDKRFTPRDADNRISFRASPQTLEVLAALGDRHKISPSVAARRILEDTVHAGPIRQTLDLVVDRLLVLDELVRIMLSDVEAERLGEAEYLARLRAISLRDGGGQ